MRICLLIFCLLAPPAFGENTLTFKGYVDTNYVYNFNNPPAVTPPTDTNQTPPPPNNKYRMFDPYHDQFNLSLVEAQLTYVHGKTSALIAFDFGTSADVLSPRDQATRHISQAVVGYQINPDLKLSAGKMMTHMGWEVFRASDNWNYSRSALFSFAIPLWHTGLALNYARENWSAAGFLYNENAGVYEQNRGKTVGAQLKSKLLDKSEVTYNFMSGSENDAVGATRVRTLHEFILTHDFNESLSFAVDFVFGQLVHAKLTGRTAEWNAFSAALKYKVGDFYFSPRYENFTDRSGASVEGVSASRPSLPQRLQSGTLTAAWSAGDGLSLRLEFRHDRSSAPSFLAGDGTSETQNTLTTALLYEIN